MQVETHQTLSAPSMLSVPEALIRLTVYRTIPRNVSEALEWLGEKREYNEFLYLYHQMFPNEYAASEASIEIEETWSYSPREVEFLFLVDEHFFPLDIDSMSDAGMNGERIEVIYPCPYHMPWWHEPESLSVGWQALRLLSGIGSDQALQKLSATQCLPVDILTALGEMADVLTISPTVYVQRVRQICDQDASSPLSDLGLALALLLQKTGNPWLDTDPDNGFLYEGYWWNIDHIKEIAADYEAAQVLEHQVGAFVGWFEVDLLTRVPLCLSIVRSTLSYPNDVPISHSA